jgi:ketopantoate reductase
VVRVARAAGVRVEPFDQFEPATFVDATPASLIAAYRVLDAMAEEARHDLKVRTGYWRDIVVRKRPSEILAITGEIVRQGDALGVPTPVNRRQLELFAEIEDGRRAMSWANLDELLRVVPTSPRGTP